MSKQPIIKVKGELLQKNVKIHKLYKVNVSISIK